MAQPIGTKGSGNMKMITIAFVGGLVITTGAIMYGRMDAGQIDVSAAISNANVKRVQNNEAQITQPASRAFQNLPNGGLVGKGSDEQPTPVPAEENSDAAVATSSTPGDASQTSTDGANTEEESGDGAQSPQQ